MIIKVVRQQFYKDRTIGKMTIENQSFWTLEDTVRECSKPVEEWKINGKTAIPTGTYKLIVDFSKRFQREMPHLLDVPGFSGVRIHAGNTPEDTEGCLLVGNSVVNGQVRDSRSAFNVVMNIIDRYYDLGEEIQIQIIGVPQQGYDDLPTVA